MDLKNIRWLKKKEVKDLLNLWQKQFGIRIQDIKKQIENYIFFITSKNRIYIINSSLSDRIDDLEKYNINSIGLYIGEQYDSDNFRFNVDGANLFAKSSQKNILTLDKNNLKAWISGEDLILDEFKQKIKNYDFDNNKHLFILIKNEQGDFFGSGRISLNKNMILNYMPKSRRIKQKDAH